MKKKTDKSAKSALRLVALKSLGDLARNVVSFGESVRPVFAAKTDGAYALFTPMGKLGDVRLVFFLKSRSIGDYIAYQPKTITDNEILEMKDAPRPQLNRSVQIIPIIELWKSPFTGKEGTPKSECIKVMDYSSLIKGVIARSIEHESMGKAYVFKHKSMTYAGSFALLDDDDARSFCYAKVDLAKDFGFFRYNYNTDKVEATDTFGEHSYLYVRIINLQEPFSFFKPE